VAKKTFFTETSKTVKGKPLVSEARKQIGTAGRRHAETSAHESEMVFRSLVSCLPDVVVRFDRDLRHQYVSPNIEEYTGLAPEAFLGKTNREIGMPEHLCVLWDEARRVVFDTGKAETIEFTFDTPNNRPSHFELRIVPEFCSDGSVRTVLSITRDITDRKRIEGQLAESEERFRAVFENSMDGILFSAPDGRIFDANPAVCKMTGYSEGELIELGMNHVLDLADPRLPEALEERRTKSCFKGELNYRRKDGSTFPVELTSVVFKNRKGEDRASTVVRDITERKRYENELRRAEQEIRTISDNVPGLVSYVDKDGCYRFVNGRYEEWFRIPRSRIVGRHLVEVLGEKAFDRISVHVKRVLSGKRVSFEDEIHYSEIGRRWVQVEYVPDADTAGKIKGYFALITDVTERKRTEEALREGEERFSTIFHASPISIAIARIKDSTIIDVNPAWEKVTGFSRDEAVGHTSTELGLWINPDDRNRLIDKLRQGGTVKDFELRLRHKTGLLTDMLMSAEFIELGGEPCLLTLAQDITSLKQLEQEVRASQRMNTIAQVAAGVAHEVRNPLNGILAVTEALSLTLQEDQERKPYLDHIRSQVDRLAGLMQDLLELGKPLKPAPLEGKRLLEICKAAVEEWEHYGSCKANQVHLICRPGISEITVLADATRLEQAFVNLLENGSQHSPEGSEIDFAIFETSDFHLGVRIVDRGTGIPMENLPRVFDPFFTTRRKGTGLGLSVVKQIIESHGGSVRIYNNDPPPGCTVEISLPIAPED
jgi:PAS domain S-box-containing protein